ncbi:MAG TPA: hypothetical protein VMU19_01630, partial [Bryobacteraceae bacterium]|nr:hypothetical protein [Bryobacteraceae bacterium]
MPLRGGSSWLGVAALAACAFFTLPASAQVYAWTPDQLAKFTAQNPYPRFPDGRPKVPDDILDKVKALTIMAQDVELPRGYSSQFVDSLKNLHPEKKMVGRALTIQLAPARPDVSEVAQAEWRAKGN